MSIRWRVRRGAGGARVEFLGPVADAGEGAGLEVLEVFGDAAGDVAGRDRVSLITTVRRPARWIRVRLAT